MSSCKGLVFLEMKHSSFLFAGLYVILVDFQFFDLEKLSYADIIVVTPRKPMEKIL